MRVTNYKAVLGESNRTELVKESAVNYPALDRLNNPERFAKLMREVYEMDQQAVEMIYLAALDSKSRLIGMFLLSKGTVNASILAPREVYMTSLMIGAVNIIICHNHPSGCPDPSEDDKLSTRRVIDAGKLVGVKLVDHIIIGADKYFSFAENGLIN